MSEMSDGAKAACWILAFVLSLFLFYLTVGGEWPLLAWLVPVTVVLYGALTFRPFGYTEAFVLGFTLLGASTAFYLRTFGGY